MNIQLSDEEAEILRSVLENDVADLRMEVSNTDSADFREALKQREAVLKRLIVRLGSSLA